MNRPLEFRAWYKLHKKLYYNVGLSLIGVQVYGETEEEQPPETIILDMGMDLFHVMQYTGLQDKNGEKIFEGDILEAHGKSGGILRAQVVFEHGVYFLSGWEGNKKRAFKDILFGWVQHCAITGNIHEHPELLK